MIAITTKPWGYKGPVHWYASHWGQNTIELFNTKLEAVAKAREWEATGDPKDVICVDWFKPDANPREAISSTAKIIDRRTQLETAHD